MCIAYALHVGYQDAKAGLSDPEGNLDLKKISRLNLVIEKTDTSKPSGVLLRDQFEKEIKRSGLNKIDVMNQLIEKYGDAYAEISNAVAAAAIDDKHFLFQLSDRTVDGAEEKDKFLYQEEIMGFDSMAFRVNDKRVLSAEEVEQIDSISLKEGDYILVTLGDAEASHDAPADWYNQDLGGHLIVGGPAVAPKSTNISNGTPSASSTGRNNVTKEEMEAEMKEEKHKG